MGIILNTTIMSSYILKTIPLLMCLFFGACTTTTTSVNPQTFVCYGFDVRQCQADIFASAVTASSVAGRSDQMKDWLQNQGLEIGRVIVIEDFYDTVCEACTICPETFRFFVQVEDDATSAEMDIQRLELFNLEEVNCGDFF